MAKSTGDIKTKAENKQAIFRYILNQGSATRQELYTRLSLSLPTIKQAIETMMSEGLIEIGEKKENTGGRNADSYCICADGRYAIGIFITLRHINCLAVNMGGQILYTKRISCKLNLQDPEYMRLLSNLIEDVKQAAIPDEEKFLGVGIAIPSLVSRDGEAAVFGMASDFTGVTRKYFSEYIPYPVRIYHDSEAGGFSEVWGCPDRRNIVYINLNYTVGSAVFIDGKLSAGDNQRAGELGHLIIDPGCKKKCYCGRIGCYDTMGNVSVLDSYTNGNLAEFFELLAKKEEGALDLWDTYTDNLALAIHNIRMMYDSTVIIGGYIGSYITPFMDSLYAKVDKLSIFTPFSRTYLFPGKNGMDSEAVGAALKVINHYIETIL